MEIFRRTASFTDYESNVLPHSSKAHLKTHLFLGTGPHLVFPFIILEKDLSMVAWRSSIATEIFSLTLIRLNLPHGKVFYTKLPARTPEM